MFKDVYPIQGVEAIETKFKTTTASSSNAFDILITNPGTKTSSHTLNPFIFDILDYKVPGIGLIGTLTENYSNAITTSGTVADISNRKNGPLTFKRPADASLSNNISWKNANQVIGSYKKSGVTAEFNFRILNGVQINVAPQARVQYGFHTNSTITPIKIWSNYAYVNHTLN
ncbi:hypothetical protein P4H67_12580 [Paenibacillus lautus]|uniref:hypothetical protein n=1 Tax=Paenibacillus lautus TaxID=1401 RepID=UPI002DBF8251|nr:hypothetical protein [Paenibacillus lautus]MEC0307582.1 hypothetical protein [Paenibacillus lautus]